ncbi:hypothetical protein C4569_02760 [Candidatus Parcubacteria bacterium]|nr:MAG: hypothetical protein C4569_02760 [Candidatus Parcubacteria bacterium]
MLIYDVLFITVYFTWQGPLIIKIARGVQDTQPIFIEAGVCRNHGANPQKGARLVKGGIEGCFVRIGQGGGDKKIKKYRSAAALPRFSFLSVNLQTDLPSWLCQTVEGVRLIFPS